MKMPVFRFSLWVFALCLTAAGARAETLDEQLAPREVLWNFPPDDVTDVFVDAAGECFYLAGGNPAESLYVSPAGLVSAGFRPVLRDRTGRLWCVTPAGNRLEGIDGRGEIVVVDAPEGAFYATTEEDGPEIRFRTAAFEDRAGRLWFGHTRGVQWFDGTEWHSKDLASAAGLELSQPMSTLRIVEDEAGRLLFWAAWPRQQAVQNRIYANLPPCGTQGFWILDHGEWSHFSTQQGLPDDQLEAVMPAGRDAVFINTSKFRVVRVDLRTMDLSAEVARLVASLNSDRWQTREEATESLKRLGPKIVLELRSIPIEDQSAEMRSRIKMVLDSFTEPGPARQSLPDSEYTCGPVWFRATSGGQWFALASQVQDAKKNQLESAAFLLAPGSTQLLDGWPAFDADGGISVAADGSGGVWVGTKGRLAHWDGTRVIVVEDVPARTYTRILGLDRRGRLILTNGQNIAVYWPGKPAGQ